MSDTKIGREIEKKFICRIIGDPPDASTGMRIEQVYLSVGDPQVRIRCVDGQYVQTVKDRATNLEVEFTLGDDVGRALFDIAPTQPILKTRFVEGPWEIDVFAGRFDGLVFLEIEDPPATLPPMPAWLECVEETGVGNIDMATMTAAAIAALVARSR
ncbi:CYTH domain-containing protein [soil metagenome]